MSRAEKNIRSRRKIIDSAIEEFGNNSYTEASVNDICKTGNISKGIVYHYFKDKEELYLICVKECFDKFADALKNEEYSFNNFEQDIKRYLDLRHKFFKENPHYSNIFFNAVLQPPKHMAQKIKQMKNDLDILNTNYYKQALENVSLKEDVNHEEAIEYFLMFQEMFNVYFQRKAYDGLDFNTLIEDHELKLTKILKIMLYGITKEKTKQ